MMQRINNNSESASTQSATQHQTTPQKSPYVTRQGKKGPIQAKQRPVNKSVPEPRIIDPFEVKPNAGVEAYQQAMSEYAGENSGISLIQRKPNNTGLPDNLKSGIENLSGYNMDDVKVHYNSNKPAQLQAHAYAQGTDIHIAPGQENHLAHEAWHVVQQKQGRVKPTMQMKGKINVNDDVGLEKEADLMADQLNNQNYQNDVQNLVFANRPKSNLIQRAAIVERGLGIFNSIPHWEIVAYNIDDETWYQAGIQERNLSSFEKFQKIVQGVVKREAADVAKTKLTQISEALSEQEENGGLEPIKTKPLFAAMMYKEKKIPMARGFSLRSIEPNFPENGSRQEKLDYLTNHDLPVSRTFPQKGKNVSFNPFLKNCQTFVQHILESNNINMNAQKTQERYLSIQNQIFNDDELDLEKRDDTIPYENSDLHSKMLKYK